MLPIYVVVYSIGELGFEQTSIAYAGEFMDQAREQAEKIREDCPKKSQFFSLNWVEIEVWKNGKFVKRLELEV